MKHIIILYKRFEAHILELFTGFFRLCGIYGLEYTLEQVFDESWEIRNDCPVKKSDVVLALNMNEKEHTALKESGLSDYLVFQKFEEFDAYRNGNIDIAAEIIKNTIEMIKRVGDGRVFEDFDLDMMNAIVDQYLEHHLMYENFQIRLLFDKSDIKKTTERMIDDFSGAAEAIRKEAEEKGNSRYSFYFVHECERKANIACRIGDWSRKYRSEEVLSEISEYLERYEDCGTTLYALCGMFADEDINYVRDAEYYYMQALGQNYKVKYQEVDERIQGYSHYRLARYYEKVRENNAEAAKHYWEAYNADRANYRFTYKVAFMYELDGKWENAEAYYREILDGMKPYLDENYLQPSQCEYAFKVYFRLMLMYKSKMGQLRLAAYMGNKALELKESLKNNKFFEAFYRPDQVEKFKELMQKRMQTKNVEEQLSDIELLSRRFQI